MPSASSRSSRARIFLVAAALADARRPLPRSRRSRRPIRRADPPQPRQRATTVSSNPVLSWSAVTGAAKYRVQISTELRLRPARLQRGHRQPEGDAAGGPAAWASSTGASPAPTAAPALGRSPTGTFTKEWGTAPDRSTRRPTATPSTSRTEPVLFDWQPLAGAKSYTLEIDDDDQFILPTTFTTNNTNFTLTEPPTIDQSSAGGSGRPPRQAASSASGRSRASTPTPGRRSRRSSRRPTMSARRSATSRSAGRRSSARRPTRSRSAPTATGTTTCRDVDDQGHEVQHPDQPRQRLLFLACPGRRTRRAPPTTAPGRPSGSSPATGRSSPTRSPRSTTA